MKKFVLLGVCIILIIGSFVWIGWKKQSALNNLSYGVKQQLPASLTIIAKSTSSGLPPIICDVTLKNTFKRDTLVAVNGQYRKVFSLFGPTYIDLYVPGNSVRIFLAPGYKSVIKLNVDLKSTFAFEGDGDLGNSYLRDVLSASRVDFPHVLVNNVLTTPTDFANKAGRVAAKRDSVFQQYIKIYGSALSKDSVLSKLFEIEKDENRFFLPRVLMNYALSRELPFEDRQLFFENHIKILPQIYEQVDSLSCENKRYFFPNLLSYYVDRARANGDSSKIVKMGIYAYMLETTKKQFSGSTQSYLIEYYLYILADFTKIYNPEYPSIVSLINLYKSNLSESSRNNLLKKVSGMLVVNTPIEAVRQYKLISESGLEIALGQKLGRVTVVDIWATWCGPCIESFPAMVRLKEKYRDNNSVKFLWISIDQDKSKWDAAVKKMDLDSDDSFWVQGGNDSKFSNDLDLRMLPRYLIIDDKGKILEDNAPGVKPDERKLVSLIDHYIKIKN